MTQPPLWRDEAATIAAVRRPLGSLIGLLSEIDAVHGLYYLFMHFVTGAFGDGPVVLRLPSVIGATVTAAGTAALGRRLSGPWTGLIAGTLVAVAPVVSRHAQEARQYTIVTALAVVATLLLFRALEGRTRFRWYALTIMLLGTTHLFGLLLLSGHLVTVLLCGVRVRRWAAATLAGTAPCALLAALALPQSGQVDWIRTPDGVTVTALMDGLAGSPGFLGASLILIFLGREGLVWRFAAPWLVVPPVLLLTLSLWEPLYVFRYVLYCLPAGALLVAAGLQRLRFWAVPVLAVAISLAVPLHQDARVERPDDPRSLARIVQIEKRHGDALVFHHATYRRVMAAYPSAYRGLKDVFLDRRRSGLDGTEVPPERFPERLSGARRVFYVHDQGPPDPPGSPDAAKEALIPQGTAWKRAGLWLFKGGSVYVYERRLTSQQSSPGVHLGARAETSGLPRL